VEFKSSKLFSMFHMKHRCPNQR